MKLRMPSLCNGRPPPLARRERRAEITTGDLLEVRVEMPALVIFLWSPAGTRTETHATVRQTGEQRRAVPLQLQARWMDMAVPTTPVVVHLFAKVASDMARILIWTRSTRGRASSSPQADLERDDIAIKEQNDQRLISRIAPLLRRPPKHQRQEGRALLWLQRPTRRRAAVVPPVGNRPVS